MGPQVEAMLKGYGVKHRHYTPYVPQGNGKAEVFNMILIKILSKLMYEYMGS